MKKILYAAAECGPFVKTGGLGLVVGSVPKALCARGLDVRVALPLYACIGREWKEQMKKRLVFPVRLNWRQQMAVMYELHYQGVIYYFIGNDFYMGGDRPYGDVWLDIEKFSFFSRAVLELLAYLDFTPDIIHCHDWHTGMIPVYLRTEYSVDPFYNNIRTVMTIHNLKFQGKTEQAHFQDVTGLADDLFRCDLLGDQGCGNMLKGGLAFADRITTVSTSYAREIMEPSFGEGLDGLLRYRRRDLSGIVNGIDTGIYNPAADPAISRRYGIGDMTAGKKMNKADLQRQTGMPEDPSVFTMALIGRLTEQKGISLLLAILDQVLADRIQLYILGSGEEAYMEALMNAVKAHPDRLFVQFDYEDGLARKMYAGCDAVLMPSLFEPCGLSQLMAYRYGTIPLVRLTGGLKDTVKAYEEKKSTATGFAFEDYSPAALLAAMEEAMTVFYQKPRAWNTIARRCMLEDYSWEKQSGYYSDLYEKMSS